MKAWRDRCVNKKADQTTAYILQGNTGIASLRFKTSIISHVGKYLARELLIQKQTGKDTQKSRKVSFHFYFSFALIPMEKA